MKNDISGITDVKPKVDRRKTMPHLQKAGAPSINPNGRPKGSRNKLSESFLKDFLAVWETDGRDALIDVRIKDPSTFIRAAVAILPKELSVAHDVSEIEALLEQFDIEELDKFITGIATLSVGAASKEAKIKIESGSESNTIH